MLDHLPVFVQPKDVDARPIGSTRPHLMAVQYDVVPLCNDPHEPHLLARVLLCHPVEVVNEGVLAICHHRVVLRIAVSDVPLDRLGGTAPVEHQVIELHDPPFVLLKSVHELNPLRLLRSLEFPGMLTAHDRPESGEIRKRFDRPYPAWSLTAKQTGI